MFISAQLTYAYVEKKFYIQPLVIISFIFSISYLAAQKDWTYKTGESSVGIVQANIAPEIKWDFSYTKKILHTYSTLTNQLSNHDLIIWPETASPVTYNDAQILIDSLRQFTQANDNTVILGIVKEVSDQMSAQSFGNYFNSIVAISANTPLYFYNKHKLLPFGEYTPFESILLPLKELLQIPMSTFMAGDANQAIFSKDNIIASIYLCYEDLFPHYVRKQASTANLLIAISDDAWFGFSQGAYQHLLIARVRAAELGRHLVRATNTGISAFINHKGNIVKRTGELHTQATLSAQVELRQGKTPFATYGSTPLLFIIMLVILGCIVPCFYTLMHNMSNND
jgi:apolipoprotein N-acyltransferase